MENNTYTVIAWLVGVLTFLGLWWYAITSWGLLLGLAVGWFPAMIGGAIVGFLWPLAAILIFVIIVFARR